MKSSAVSFVIPVINESDTIGNLLRVLRRLHPESELIVVDGGSADDTVAQALPLCTAVLTSDPGRARQMNLGADVAAGEYIFFLHADSIPSIDQAGLREALVAKPQWGFCRARLSGQRPAFRLIEGAMNIRSRLTGVATGDQMLFARRDFFTREGRFADIPLMEDVELCKRLRRRTRPLVIAQPVLTSSRRWENRGIVRTIVQMWALRLGYVLGVSPHTLWRHYYG